MKKDSLLKTGLRTNVVLWLALTLIGQGIGSAVERDNGTKVDFNRDIAPILSDHCYACHGPDAGKRKANLRLDQKEGIFSTLKDGVVTIKPGSPDQSQIVRRVNASDPDEMMPPPDSGKPLDLRKKRLLKQWVEEGAPWEGHWAYITPQRPEVPEVSDPSWPRHPLDHFIKARLDRENLKPSPEADKNTLIRRATYDLTGLPPTLDELDTFLNDDSEEAYEHMVDRLLTSPRYGERMAEQWLDLARFADSDGYHADHPRSMWHYRDWVIHSFNKNQPFDQFTIDQIAGDLLPESSLDQKIATAFNRNGMSSTEGGADPEEYLNKYVTDRVNTLGTVWLGTTLKCTECHDHKYDPFTQEEYYRLYDFFSRIPERGLDKDPAPPFVRVPSEDQEKRIQSLSREIKPLELKIKLALSRPNEKLDQDQDQWIKDHLEGQVEPEVLELSDWHSAGPFPAASGDEAYDTSFPPEKGIDLKTTYLDGKLAWIEHSDWKDGEIHSLTGTNAATYLHREIIAPHDGEFTLNFGSDDALRVWVNGKEVLSKKVQRGVQANQDNIPVKLKQGKSRLLAKVVNYGGAFGFYFSQGASNDEALKKILELAKTPEQERQPGDIKAIREFYRRRFVAEIRDDEGQLQALNQQLGQLNKSLPTVRIMQDQPKYRETRIRVRGDYRSKGKVVTAGTPAVLPPLPPSTTTNRLDLARWLVSPNHPLVSRVAVNRIWQLFFGTGIVKTSDEFGVQGERPSHPDLIDWLAREFIDSGWNVKKLVRGIMTSATYRQNSDLTPGLQELDPENRLLARGPRYRMSAEMIRDGALAYSGLLDDSGKIGGPSVRPFQPPGLWAAMMFGGNKYAEGGANEKFRRSLYTLWKRTVPYPMFQTFDAPDRALCTDRRTATCTPLQAFVTLNEKTFVEAARVLAQRIIRDGGTSIDERLDFAFKTVLARLPIDSEREILTNIQQDMMATYQSNQEEAKKLLAIGYSKAPEELEVTELAAWTATANVLLNLDETITKE